ncbi:MAG: hypothetical protein WC373_05185 [Smithella sp.]|jgi:Skp family chaperone for outer membrane proteins
MPNDLIIKLPKFSDQVSISGEWIDTRNDITTRAAKIVKIDSAESFQLAGELLQEITKHSNALEKMRQALTAPFLDVQKTIKGKSDDARDSLEKLKPTLQKKMADYLTEERKRVEKEKRENEEKQRQEILAQQAEQDALKEIGLVEKEAEFVPEVIAAPPIVRAPVSHSVRMQENIVHEIIDEALIPAAFKTFDERKLNAWKRDNNDLLKKRLKESGNTDEGRLFVTGINFKIELKPIGR